MGRLGAPQLSCPEEPSDTGAYKLHWSAEGAVRFRLEENGELLYSGEQMATTVSGRPSGTYHYRLGAYRQEGIPGWAECSVSVQPPSMGTALAFFGVGLAVFIATVVAVVKGHRAHKAEQR